METKELQTTNFDYRSLQVRLYVFTASLRISGCNASLVSPQSFRHAAVYLYIDFWQFNGIWLQEQRAMQSDVAGLTMDMLSSMKSSFTMEKIIAISLEAD